MSPTSYQTAPPRETFYKIATDNWFVNWKLPWPAVLILPLNSRKVGAENAQREWFCRILSGGKSDDKGRSFSRHAYSPYITLVCGNNLIGY